MVSYEEQAYSLLHEAAHAFAEVALGGEVEGVGGLVEEKLAGAVDEGAGDLDAALFSGGHFSYWLFGEVGGVDAFESFGGAVAHFFCYDEVGPEAGGGEESCDDGIEAGGASGGAACGVRGAVGDALQAAEGVRDGAEVLAEFGEVPAVAAKDGDFRAGLAGVGVVSGGGDDGVELAVHGADEGGFAAAVGAEDGDVFTGGDGEVDVVEDDGVAQGDVDVAHVEEGVFGVGGLGCHLC